MAGDFLEVAHVSRALAKIAYPTDTMRSYAAVFEAQRRDFQGGPLRQPSEISVLAADCIRLVADLKDMEPVPNAAVTEFIDGKYLER